MTPATVAGLCRLAGLDAAALTDHNTCGNCPAFCAAAQAYGLLPLPGMELCTLEEVHVICLFPSLDQAMAFQDLVYRRLGDRINAPGIFGRQVRMLVEGFGGVAYPAHIDRDSFSLLSNLGLWDPALGFPLAEVSRRCPPDLFCIRRDLRGVPSVMGSDAHYLDQIQDAHQWMEVPSRSPEAVLAWMRRGGM